MNYTLRHSIHRLDELYFQQQQRIHGTRIASRGMYWAGYDISIALAVLANRR